VYITHRAHTPSNEIATGHVGEYECDHRNRLVKVIERASEGGAATQVVQHTYDYPNRWVGRSVDPDGDGPLVAPQYTYAYDDAGNLLSETDPEGHTTQYEYDALGQLLRVIDAGGDATQQLEFRGHHTQLIILPSELRIVSPELPLVGWPGVLEKAVELGKLALDRCRRRGNNHLVVLRS
jgi:YD repeat-containing protein